MLFSHSPLRKVTKQHTNHMYFCIISVEGTQWFMHPSMVCPLAYLGWYLVGIVLIHPNGIHILFHCVKYLWNTLCELHKYPYLLVTHCVWHGDMGQVKNTEVRKLKYGSEKKNHLSVFSALLTHDFVCWDLGSQRVTLFLQYESRILGSRTTGSVAIVMHVARPKPKLMVSGPTMQALCSWNSCDSCEYCHSSLPKIFTKFGSTSSKTYSRDTINNCVSARWNPNMSVFGSHIAWRQSPFGYKAVSSHFRTLVSILPFPHFSTFHFPGRYGVFVKGMVYMFVLQVYM